MVSQYVSYDLLRRFFFTIGRDLQALQAYYKGRDDPDRRSTCTIIFTSAFSLELNTPNIIW